MKINRQALKDLRGLRPGLRAVFLHNGVFHIGHEQRAVPLTSSDEHIFHRLRTWLVAEVGDKCETVEHLSRHGAPRVPVPASCARPSPPSAVYLPAHA